MPAPKKKKASAKPKAAKKPEMIPQTLLVGWREGQEHGYDVVDGHLTASEAEAAFNKIMDDINEKHGETKDYWFDVYICGYNLEVHAE